MFQDPKFLNSDAAGLYLHDPADRRIFRMRVAERLKDTPVQDMQRGINSPSSDRHTLYRGVADAYLRLHRDRITREAIREKIYDEHREGLDS